MRYITVPLLIILYGWWTISSIKELRRGGFWPEDYAVMWATAHSILALFGLIFLTIKYW